MLPAKTSATDARIRRAIIGGMLPPQSSSGIAPDIASQFNDKPELSFLCLQRHRVAGIDACKAALRADSQPVERNVPACLYCARMQCRLVLEYRRFRRNEPEHNRLMRRHVSERHEVSGARAVEFKEIEWNIESIEKAIGNAFVAAFRVPVPAAIAAA